MGRAHFECSVVVEGPVGLAWLGRSKWFRYEVRRCRGGVIPDASHAVGGPRRIGADRSQAERILDLAPGFPPRTWGRDEQRTGDMWNSNSLTAATYRPLFTALRAPSSSEPPREPVESLSRSA